MMKKTTRAAKLISISLGAVLMFGCIGCNSSDKKKADEAKKLKAAQELAAKLSDKGITVKMRAGSNGKAFGSVSGKEIAQAALEQFQVEIDRKRIQLEEPIKAFGEYEVPIRLHPQVLANLKVNIVAL